MWYGCLLNFFEELQADFFHLLVQRRGEHHDLLVVVRLHKDVLHSLSHVL